LAFHQQAADELGGDDFGRASKENDRGIGDGEERVEDIYLPKIIQSYAKEISTHEPR